MARVLLLTMLCAMLGACGYPKEGVAEDPPKKDAGPAHTKDPGDPSTVATPSGGTSTDSDSGMPDAGTPALPGVCGPDCHVMFVTSKTFMGNIGGVTAADSNCATVAAASTNADIRARSSRFIAWISDSASGIATRLPQTGSYARTDGTAIAGSRAELISGQLKINIILDESGNEIQTGGLVGASWTGSTGAGTASSHNCNDWSSAAAGAGGDIGRATSSDSTWTLYDQAACNLAKHLYCIDRF